MKSTNYVDEHELTIISVSVCCFDAGSFIKKKKKSQISDLKKIYIDQNSEKRFISCVF